MQRAEVKKVTRVPGFTFFQEAGEGVRIINEMMGPRCGGGEAACTTTEFRGKCGGSAMAGSQRVLARGPNPHVSRAKG